MVLVIHQNSLIFSDVKKFGFIPPHPTPPHSLWYCGGLLPYQAPLERGCCFCGPWHWSLHGCFAPSAAARSVSPWVPGGTCPSMGFICARQGCGSSAPALGARSVFQSQPWWAALMDRLLPGLRR